MYSVLTTVNGKEKSIEDLNGKIQSLLITDTDLTDELTHFSPVSHFCTPWKRQKTFGFLTFSGGIEMWHWTKMG